MCSLVNLTASISYVVIFSLGLSSCAFTPYDLRGTDQIASIGPSTPSVIQSLKCEVITFLVENKLRAQYWSQNEDLLKTLDRSDPRFLSLTTTLKSLPYLDIDSKQYASLQGDLKNIDSFTASLGFGWKYVVTPVTSRDYQPSVGYSQTRTFESIQPIAIPQNADLGSSKSWVSPSDPPTPHAAHFSTLYNLHPAEDEKFFCYSSFFHSHSSSLVDAINDVQQLVVGSHDSAKLTNYPRIYIEGETFASWLQYQSGAMSLSYRTFESSPEAALPGQLEYNFTLDVKPSVGMQYNLVHQVINPFVPSLSANLEHSTNFALFLNTEYALASLQAKGGNSCVGVVKNGVCTPQQVSLPVVH